MLNSILASTTGAITVTEILLCTLASLVLGVIVALVYMVRNTYTKNFVLTIALLPVLIQAVILLVNGNLGTGVAVMGAFSLVRFRSAPGSAREISSIFFAMAIGLATGMGYIAYAVLFTIIVGLIMLLYTLLDFGEKSGNVKTLNVTIPENLDYANLFTDLFTSYTKSARLERVKTSSLGSLFELQYTIVLKDPQTEKQFIDEIRTRNGNLNISCGRSLPAREEL
ncbi:MAG: DUF4956 domain-containing protein [Oscillospiraceae bacterium]